MLSSHQTARGFPTGKTLDHMTICTAIKLQQVKQVLVQVVPIGHIHDN